MSRLSRGLGRSLVAAASIALTLTVAPQAHAVPPPPAPWAQCPALGVDTSCEILIWIDPTGHISVLHDPTQGPYDGVEDTLVGVQNDSPFFVPSLYLTSPTLPIFALDGDGLCVAAGAPAACPFGPTGYEGPGTSFTNISADKRSGTVLFGPAGPAPCNAGLPPLASTYFSLEEDVASSGLIAGAFGSGRATALSATVAPLPNVTVSDTGTVYSDAHVAALSTPPNPVVFAGVLTGDVTFGPTPIDIVADAATAKAAITVPGVVTVTANAVHAWSRTYCPAGFLTSVGNATIADLVIARPASPPITVSTSRPPNTTYVVGPVTIVVNEQIPAPRGLTVNALHVTDPSHGIDVVVSSATTND